MPKLPEEVVKLFNDPVATKVLATIDEAGNVHATPLGSLQAAPDGSIIFFAQCLTKSTPERLKYMQKAGKAAVALTQIHSPPVVKGYVVRCKVRECQVSGSLYNQVSEAIKKATGVSPIAVWTFTPIEYKICTPGPDAGKVVKL